MKHCLEFSNILCFPSTLWRRERISPGQCLASLGTGGWGGDTSVSGREDTVWSLLRGAAQLAWTPQWAINICDRDDSWPHSGLKTQRQLRSVMALSSRRPVITCGLSGHADDTPSDTESYFSIFRGNHHLPQTLVRCVCKQCKWERWQMECSDCQTNACARLSVLSSSQLKGVIPLHQESRRQTRCFKSAFWPRKVVRRAVRLAN